MGGVCVCVCAEGGGCSGKGRGQMCVCELWGDCLVTVIVCCPMWRG